jgi:hypothetical protein
MVGPALGEGLHRDAKLDVLAEVVGAVFEQCAGVLVEPALGKGLHCGLPDKRVVGDCGAVGEQGAGVLVGPALGKGRWHRGLGAGPVKDRGTVSE